MSKRGHITFIGATTENPSFGTHLGASVAYQGLSASRSRSQRNHNPVAAGAVYTRARPWPSEASHRRRTAGGDCSRFEPGDARAALNTLEMAAGLAEDGGVSRQAVLDALQQKVLLYDKGGEEHFNLISALHKSVRSSDPDAALYWLARMMKSGEDRLYLVRRLIRMAIEDIGLADPRAVEQAIACMQIVHFLGVPEGDQALAQLALYLALAPKSDAAYRALNHANSVIDSTRAEPVPMHLRNAPTRLMKQMGYSKGYQHAHAQADALTATDCLPDSLLQTVFYEPTQRGFERQLAERLAWLKAEKDGKNRKRKRRRILMEKPLRIKERKSFFCVS